MRRRMYVMASVTAMTIIGIGVAVPAQTFANDLTVSVYTTLNMGDSLATVMGNLTIKSQLTLDSSNTSGSPYSLTFGNVTITGNSTFIIDSSAGGGAGTLVLGPVTDPGAYGMEVYGTGTAVLTGNSSPGNVNVGSLLDVEGSATIPYLSLGGGGTLGGKGTVLGEFVDVGTDGVLAPSLRGTTPAGGPLTIEDNLVFDNAQARLGMDLQSTTPGSGYDQVQYATEARLNSATLLLNDSLQSSVEGQRFWILDGLPGSTAVNGSLSYQGNVLADGATFSDSAGHQFVINYNAPGDPNGTGNDVLLTTTPEPSSGGLLLAFATGLLLRRRRMSKVD